MQPVVTQASAPGKVILMGEHAVVYGRPAVALPVFQVQATAQLRTEPGTHELWLDAVDLQQRRALSDTPDTDPLALCVRRTCAALGVDPPTGQLTVSATIPLAGGLGSGAAISTAVVRALAGWAGRRLSPAEVSELVFAVEALHHGTPSGIDNTVIAYACPVWFVKGQTPAPFAVPHAFTLVIANSGIPSPTRVTVGDVRQAWLAAPELYERLFDQVGFLVRAARDALLAGSWPDLGSLMSQNHALLVQLGVSSPQLDGLVQAAQDAGAWGAKLSGGGRGGNVIALVSAASAEAVAAALRNAGAASTIVTHVPATKD
jgi:mevalonate kinase